MQHMIDDENIEYISILAKLALTAEEKEQEKEDLGRMLSYIDKLNELDTTQIEPMSHVFQMNNVMREDSVTNEDCRKEILRNAPKEKDRMFVVPKTLE